MTQVDLRAVHDILLANHPGPVDPQNPQFRIWLEQGLVQSMARAGTVHDFADYRRTLRFYVNGFEDGHISVGFTESALGLSWPGFTVRATTAADAEVAYAELDSGVTKGVRLVSCDGNSLDKLMAEWVDPYYWNAALPHERYTNIENLFFQDVVDSRPKIKTCRFSSGDVTLKWRDDYDINVDKLFRLQGSWSRLPRMREIDGIWLVSIPTFDYQTKQEIQAVQALISEIKANASVLRRSTVIFDVRHNNGGSSTWGERIASALWGQAWVDRIIGQFDETVDWRVSPSNLAHLDDIIAYMHQIGDTDSKDWAYVMGARSAVVLALKDHKALARVAGHPRVPNDPPPPNPVKGRIYFLTDGACGSACLDFADIMRRLPGVTHVGQPTYADSIYMEADEKLLPSSLATLEYGTKADRNRLRKNNEWYSPKISWPGGSMDGDEAVVNWIRTLH